MRLARADASWETPHHTVAHHETGGVMFPVRTFIRTLPAVALFVAQVVCRRQPTPSRATSTQPSG
jgi:hypothetical protein